MNKKLTVAVFISALVLAGGLAYFSMGPDEPAPTPVGEQGDAPIVEVRTSAVTTNSTAVVSGTVNPNGASTEYWYEYGDSTNLGLRTAAYSIGSGFNPINAPGYIEDLKITATYYYRLNAKNIHGTSRSAVFNFNTTNEAPKPPGRAPTANTQEATRVERTTAQVNGEVNPRGWPTTYWFEYGQTSDLGLVTAFQSAGSATVSTPIYAALTGLNPLSKYYFRINVQNQYGTVNGDVMTFTTTGPLSPSKPTVYTDNAQGISKNSVTLRGRVNPNAAATTYWFEYGKDATLGNIVAASTPVQNAGDGTVTLSVSAKITGLSADTGYFYRLVASNQFGITRGDGESFTTDK